ncbi:hypothetical protein [Fibrobacter sp.]|uniref:hypothetical protein n=1 Tax=Fibrobacter sp. TaxID=35828 RepID=UPI0025C29FD3|nr:hypothetical protein [Fibrobacter sp.]MBR4007303.1 hypothetical protein [Fibrobacter sp.]
MKIDKTRIINKLTEKGAVLSCSRCGHQFFSVLDGNAKIILDENIDANIRIGGPTVPVAVVVCANCGAITMHALGALGLLDEQGGQNESNA